MTDHLPLSLRHNAGGAILLIAALALPTHADARQYISLVPNYTSSLVNGAALDYWTFDHSPENPQHQISQLWDMPNAAIFTSADFECCIHNYNKSDKKISFTPSFTLGEEDFPGVMELHLAMLPDGSNPWNISRVEIYAVNAFDPDWNYHPSFTINGIRATLPEGNERDYCGVDFPESDSPISVLRFETPANSRVSFWDMKIYLRGCPQLPDGYVMPARATYGHSDPLRLPTVKIATLDPAADGRLQCSLLDADGTVAVATTDASEGDFSLDISSLEEGCYTICYHIPDPTLAGEERCFPDPEDGFAFEIAPSFEGLLLNGARPADVMADDCVCIPVDDEHGLSLDAVSISGLRDGVAVYWRTTSSAAAEALTASGSDPDLAGYTLYDPAAGMDLRNADTLHLILEKNGARSEGLSYRYTSSVEVGVGVIESDADRADEVWYTTDGLPADPASSPGRILIRSRRPSLPGRILTR